MYTQMGVRVCKTYSQHSMDLEDAAFKHDVWAKRAWEFLKE